MKATLERELKLGAGPRFRLPALPGKPLAPRTLTSIYLDTPDHRLALGVCPSNHVSTLRPLEVRR
jgi:hypothetical protein